MAGNSVDLKANANGLVVVFDPNASFEGICEQLARRLESGGLFFQTRYLATTYRGRKLSAEEEGRISRLMAEKTGAKTVLFEYDKDFERTNVPSGGATHTGITSADIMSADAAHADMAATGATSVGGIAAAGPASSSEAEGARMRDELRARDVAAAVRRRYAAQDLEECMTKFFRGTLRSGKLISYDGNVVVIGDINPGAEVEATGNIIVLGNVRGIVHAGAGGNKETTVIALRFAPTQLRIADIITNKVERRAGAGSTPSVAYIKGDAIVFDTL